MSNNYVHFLTVPSCGGEKFVMKQVRTNSSSTVVVFETQQKSLEGVSGVSF